MEELRPWNPHWFGAGVTPRVLKHPRERAMVRHWVCDVLEPAGGMWALKPGPRQVGKTTSLGHVARRLLAAEGMDPRRVTIAPLDDEAIVHAVQGRLEALIAAVFESKAPAPDEPAFLLLDEVQAFPDWARQLKTAWDRHHGYLRVLATGSSALRLLRPADADFDGRIRTVAVHPMKFREVVGAHRGLGHHVPAETWAELEEVARRCRTGLLNGHEAFGRALEDMHGRLAAHGLAPFLRQVWLEYCAWGGYPAVRPGVELRPAERLDRMEGALNTVIASDVIASGVRKVRQFRLLFRHIALNPGGKFEPFSVGNRLDLPGQTIQEWKAILEDVMLVQQLPALKPNLAPASGRDKAYPLDPAWCSYFRGHIQASADPDASSIGLAVESVLVDHVRRLQFNLQGTTALPIGFVDRPEVDVVADLGERRLFVEAKYSRHPQAHVDKLGEPDDIRVVVTRDRFETGPPGAAHAVPAEEFAFLC